MRAANLATWQFLSVSTRFSLFPALCFRHILQPAYFCGWKTGGVLMHICELIKNQETYRADAMQTVLDVAQAMVDRNIGAVPVLRDGLLVGIFSERDLMKRVVVGGLQAGSTRVGEVMTSDPLTVNPQETPDNCMLLMRRHGFRHLPVC